MLTLYNTRTRTKEVFKPLHETVGLYACGPTVYHNVHLGNHRTYILTDVLKRTLKYNGYSVNHVMNITDVGHLTDDGDFGEDKMEKGAAREGKSAWDIAKMYTNAFLQDIESLHILPAKTLCKATEHIDEQIVQVQQLIDGGFTYETADGIYFDTTKLDDYGALIQLAEQDLQAGNRVDMGEKKNPHDFALWKFTKDGEKRQMEWEAFGRSGFPGWHIECSAMSMKYLGDQFDIHTGGVDLSRVHHINEIAQAESVTHKKPWVNFWVHGEFLLMGNDKMSKSDNNFLTLELLQEKGFEPLAYRYFVLQAHYRKQLNFTWDAIEAAQNGLKKLRKQVNALGPEAVTDPLVEEAFLRAINDDLNMPEALAVLWKALKDKAINLETAIAFDKVLGLNLHQIVETTVPTEVQHLLDQRKTARHEKNWEESDRLRDAIADLGFIVEDTADGQTVQPA